MIIALVKCGKFDHNNVAQTLKFDCNDIAWTTLKFDWDAKHSNDLKDWLWWRSTKQWWSSIVMPIFQRSWRSITMKIMQVMLKFDHNVNWSNNLEYWSWWRSQKWLVDLIATRTPRFNHDDDHSNDHEVWLHWWSYIRSWRLILMTITWVCILMMLMNTSEFDGDFAMMFTNATSHDGQPTTNATTQIVKCNFNRRLQVSRETATTMVKHNGKAM